MNRIQRLGQAFVLALAAAVTAGGGVRSTPAPGTTEPPGLSSGKLANRQFMVRNAEDAGIARYYGNGSLDGSGSATRAIVIVHGVLRNADTYFATGEAVLAAAHAKRTLLIAPQFVEQSDLKGKNVSAATLRWSDEWPGGAPATAPAPISTYAVFDAIIARLADRSRFPAMRSIAIIGHSAGRRFARGKAYIAYMRKRHSSGTSQDYAFVGGVGHDNRKMFASACGIAVVFDRPRTPCAKFGKI